MADVARRVFFFAELQQQIHIVRHNVLGSNRSAVNRRAQKSNQSQQKKLARKAKVNANNQQSTERRKLQITCAISSPELFAIVRNNSMSMGIAPAATTAKSEVEQA